MLLDAFELSRGRALEVLVADAEMDRGPVRQLSTGSGEHLLKQRFRLFEFVLLQGAQSSLITLQSLSEARIFRNRLFLGGSLLSHVKNFSCDRRNGTP